MEWSSPKVLRASVALAALAVGIAACGGGAQPASSGADDTPSPGSSSAGASDAAASAAPSSTMALDPGRQAFAVAEEGRRLVLLCEGEGTPTVILEDGHPSETGGIDRFRTGPIWDDLVSHTRVCAYDRAGYGDSDPAPNEPRTADDVVDDLQALLAAAGEEGPFVLVGSSFGGFIVSYYAAREPDDVVGVVLLDVPAPTDTLTLEEIPEIAWDHPANPEHVDVISEFETRFARNPEPIQAPLTIITASGGQSDVEDQAFWFQINPDATQIELTGGHDIDLDNPTGVVAEILAIVDATR
jgi:hypothetical protein